MRRVTVDGLVVGFDLDMTLIDSADAITATMAAAIAASPGGEGVRITRDKVWPLVGLPLEATVATLAPTVDPGVAVREYRDRYASIGAPMVTLLPGAPEAFAAVRETGGRSVVWLVREGRLQAREVEAGPVSGGYREIARGLVGGERVMTGGVENPREGMRVKTSQ